MSDFPKFQRQTRHRGGTSQAFDQGGQGSRLIGCPLLPRIIQGPENGGWNPQTYGYYNPDSQKVRSHALDAGVRIAVENHAGDMHSRELVELIEQAGPEFVGATIDTGNSTWTLEDPVETFRNLAPYAICSGIRDSMIWPSEKGAKVQWTAMGDGCVDMKTLFNEWSKKCPDTPVQIEPFQDLPGNFRISKKIFWPPYSSIRADDYSRFLALSRKRK